MLDTAIGLFARLGFDAVSIRRIAEDSGVSLAMVHHYFGGMDALYDACIESMYVDLAAMRVQLASGSNAKPCSPEARKALLDRFALLPFIVPTRDHHIEAAELRAWRGGRGAT